MVSKWDSSDDSSWQWREETTWSESWQVNRMFQDDRLFRCWKNLLAGKLCEVPQHHLHTNFLFKCTVSLLIFSSSAIILTVRLHSFHSGVLFVLTISSDFVLVRHPCGCQTQFHPFFQKLFTKTWALLDMSYIIAYISKVLVGCH
jgi:hypothetical protein